MCGHFLPAAHFGFRLLQRCATGLGRDRLSGAFGTAWVASMYAVTFDRVGFPGWYGAGVVLGLRG